MGSKSRTTSRASSPSGSRADAMDNNYLKPEPINLKNHPTLDEKWIQNLIENDPSILGLGGNLGVRASERRQPRAGRLDLLLRDTETERRYEVEIQLGATDESHIIRTVEYWDIERKRFPQYDHCAVIIAEDITSRFLNVVSLFNGAIPLIAIQMQAIRVGENMTVVFTKVMDELKRGLVDEDEEAEAAPADRAYWENRSTKDTVALADQMLNVLRELDLGLNLKYNKFYIGLEKEGRPFNFVEFVPRKNFFIFRLKLPESDEHDEKIDESGFVVQYDPNHGGRYLLKLTENDIQSKSEILRELSRLAYELKAKV